MYRPFHKLRVRFAEMELKQNEIAKRAGMAPSTLTARMMGYQPWTSAEIIAVSKVLDIPPTRSARSSLRTDRRMERGLHDGRFLGSIRGAAGRTGTL